MLKKAFTVMAAAISMEAGAQGTIVIAHGGDSLWNSQVIEAARAARAARTGGPVKVSFLMGPAAKTARFQDVVARLEAGGAREITVVPLLVSSHSGLELQHLLTQKPVVVVRILVSKGSINRSKLPQDLAGLPIVYSGDALLPHPEMVKWIERRAATGPKASVSEPETRLQPR